jgi:NAD(P)-dependent dehydrogenase (short-subunit alcohol dehydrogenase family)
MKLSGEVALVTGAGRGIGRQIALDLAAAGAAVGLVARTGQQLQEVAQEIAGLGGRAMIAPADVTDRVALGQAVQSVVDAFGSISIAVNNAGTDRPFGPVDVVDPDEWWQAQDLHVRAAYMVMHLVIPAMRAARKGRIINIASSGAVVVGTNCSSYCVGKATLVRLTEHVHTEIVGDGLAAFAVHPGTIMTSMGLSAMGDPDARKWAPAFVDYLTSFDGVDTDPTLHRVGGQVVALAGGHYDALAGRYLDFDVDLDQQLAALSQD